MLRDKEYETATVLNNLPPMSNPLTVAGTAVHMAQRRRVGRVVVILSGVAGAVIIWIVAATMIVLPMQRAGIISDDPRPPRSVLRTETMTLSCLSPEQAGALIEPYLRSENSAWYVSTGIPAVTVRGTAHELGKLRSLIREFDNNPGVACRAPAATVGASPTPEVGKREPTPPSGLPIGKASGLLDPKGGTTLLTPDKQTTPPKR